MLPDEGEAFTLRILSSRARKRQRDCFFRYLCDSRTLKTHVNLHLREEGFKQTLFCAKSERQCQRKRVARVRQAHRFLRINDAVLDFAGFVVWKNGFAINTYERILMTDGNRHRLRAAMSNASRNPFRPERFAAGADAGDRAFIYRTERMRGGDAACQMLGFAFASGV